MIELRFKQQYKTWKDISEIKEELKRKYFEKEELSKQVRELAQKEIPELREKLFKKMDEYDKTW